ncbi:heavy metal-associated domain-containing protein [Streptomyces sp. NPDC089799]|uniref:heavy-metal-associated domain-containing protein n=1 Tax=Streptomyces sp. NPDC089799 TaxID=3155066 RepID=UPI00342483C3
MNLFRRKDRRKDRPTDRPTDGSGEHPGGQVVVLVVEGMHCTGCGLLIDDGLEELDGVRSASTSARTGRTVIRLAPGARTDTAALVAAVESAGEPGRYRARPAG